MEVVDRLLEAGSDVHADNDYALRWASVTGHQGGLLSFWRKYKDKQIFFRNFFLSLYFLQKDDSPAGHLEVVNRLLAAGANMHADNDYALRWASRKGHLEIVERLLAAGADLHAHNDRLLEAGADVHAANEHALAWAMVKA